MGTAARPRPGTVLLPIQQRTFFRRIVIMGLWSTIKGWFNIGGVSVKLKDVNPLVPKSGNTITGKVLLTSKDDKQVVKLDYKFIQKKTTGRGNEKETKEFTLGETTFDQPFEIKKDESKTLDFAINYSIEKSLKDMGGVLGGIGKIAAFASAEKLEYFVVAQAGVKGTAFGPSDRVPVQIVD
jgi:hypothetical protein